MKELFKAEDLTGEDRYQHETHGKVEAKKFIRVKRMPPILQININRFGVSPKGEMVKINSRCDFGDTLDFDRIFKSTESF